jgi:hypothetical protein
VIDALIVKLAAKQHGNILRSQLLALGLTNNGIAHRVAIGRLHRVFPCVYAVGRPPATPLERAAAAVLAAGPGAALSHEAAGALWGFLKHWPATFDVTVRVDRRPRGIRRPPSPGRQPLYPRVCATGAFCARGPTPWLHGDSGRS